ncbi:hypothetical protein EJB05_02590, partial [Eragrostis curvula]
MVLVWVLQSVLLGLTNLYGAGLGAVGGGGCTQGEALSLPISAQDSGPRSAEARPQEHEVPYPLYRPIKNKLVPCESVVCISMVASTGSTIVTQRSSSGTIKLGTPIRGHPY